VLQSGNVPVDGALRTENSMTSKKKTPTSAIAADAPKADTQADTQAASLQHEEHPKASFPIVGIGASAGGLAAFEAFFAGMPTDVDPDMAFVLVQHLAPDHKSILTELIQRYTRMKVLEVEDAMVVQPNCAYIIPPNRDMAFLNGALHLLEPSAPRGQRLPIDFLFRSLAQDQCERAICIVLSGTGSDGALGVRAIKDAGGMVMVQAPGTTEFDGMPRSAIATCMVDYELPATEMAAQLISYVHKAFGKLPRFTAQVEPRSTNALKRIFILLRAQTSHDFSQYKPSTIHRRIERRMVVNQIEAIDGYVKFLQQSPQEVEALFRDLLIGVTNFFRDPEVFKALEEQIIPKLFDDKPAGGVVRVWSTGCSTGEEAYSIAILLQERMEALKQSYTVQVFATDIDRRAIAVARLGLYPVGIAADVSPQRLARFFTQEPDGGGYRIHKAIRDMLVFSEQDVLKDPPFSKLDLLSCRNLLIYLDGNLQKRLIPLFHYALNPNGMLFLGSSEGVGDFNDLFHTLDRKAKLYQRKADFHGMQRAAPSRFLPNPGMPDVAPAVGSAKASFPGKLPLRELTEQALLNELAPPSALVNRSGDILYLHGRTGQFLEPASGEAGVNNILKMAREGLRQDLAITLRKAVSTHATMHAMGLRVKTNGHFTTTHLSVSPVPTGAVDDPESSLYLVMLQEAPDHGHGHGVTTLQVVPPSVPSGIHAEGTTQAHELGSEADAQIAALRQELRAKDEYLQTTHEELETSNEELKSSNEEMQSVNEELQSTNEELETSKEELQSVNEELATVNSELQTKVADLSRSNNDMNNLLAGTGVATVFVDHDLRILRFTPSVTQIINLIPGDVGRPVGHIVSNLVGYDRLVADAQAVLETLVSKGVELQTKAGKWYMMRIQPYRTLSNVIEGVVLSFVDINAMVKTRVALLKTNEVLRLAVVVRDAHDAITVQDLDGRTLAWNPGAVSLYGWSETEAMAMNVRDRIPAGLHHDAQALVQRLARGETLDAYTATRLSKTGQTLAVQVTATGLIDTIGHVYAIATTERMQGGSQ
jgi:two-component system CheB/CheR fusion protein